MLCAVYSVECTQYREKKPENPNSRLEAGEAGSLESDAVLHCTALHCFSNCFPSLASSLWHTSRVLSVMIGAVQCSAVRTQLTKWAQRSAVQSADPSGFGPELRTARNTEWKTWEHAQLALALQCSAAVTCAAVTTAAITSAAITSAAVPSDAVTSAAVTTAAITSAANNSCRY